MNKTTKEAIEFLISTLELTRYRLAAELGASPSSVQQWLKETRMSKAYADLVFKLYGITITDAV